MIWKIKVYISFLRRSTNLHDLHSPFIYNYIKNGIYKGRFRKQSKSDQIFYKSMESLELRELWIQNENLLSSKMTKDTHSLQNTIDQSSCIYFNDVWPDNISSMDFRENQILVLKEPYKTKDQFTKWKNIVNHVRVLQSIDMFHTGVVFFHKSAVKEHFCIRY